MGKLKLKDFENLALISQIALIMIIPIFAGVYIGKWLDEILNTGNIFLLVMIVLGVVIAFLNLFRYAMRAVNKGSENDEE